MNDQQKIDVLNTIINERESLIWLKEIMQDVLKLRDEAGQKEAISSDLEAKCVAKQAELDGISKKYQAKEIALEKELDIIRQQYATSAATFAEQAHHEQEQILSQTNALKHQLEDIERELAKAHEALAATARKHEHAEGAMQKAIRQYEDYKASLK